MTIEEKRNFLKRYHEFVYIARNFGKQIRELRLSVLPGGIQYSDMPSAPSHGDRLASYMARLDELSEKYENALDAVFETHKAIDGLENAKHRVILNMRYVERKRVWEIAKQLNYSERRVKQMQNDALARIEIDPLVVKNADNTHGMMAKEDG